MDKFLNVAIAVAAVLAALIIGFDFGAGAILLKFNKSVDWPDQNQKVIWTQAITLETALTHAEDLKDGGFTFGGFELDK